MDSKPYWLKGGRIALIVYFVIFIFIASDSMLGFVLSMFFSPLTWCYGHDYCSDLLGLSKVMNFSITKQFLVDSIFYFITGAVIGLIYGKIKKCALKMIRN